MDVLKSLATPVVAMLALLIVGLVLTRPARKGRLFQVGWHCVLAATALLAALSLKPVAELLTYSLEGQCHIPSSGVLKSLDVVVILGGGSYPSGPLRGQAELAKEAYPRLYHGVEYFKESGAGVLAFCGGPRQPGAESEAEIMKRMAGPLGVPLEETLAETTSHNTMEDAANLAKLLPEGRDRHIGLVTSATHMLRSRKVFEAVFPYDRIVPIPVYFTYDPVGWSVESIMPSSGNFEKSSIALHEWLGLAWYAVRY
jgi:uncharacterized SAM-binding protein YcdF (DUF218 family)